MQRASPKWSESVRTTRQRQQKETSLEERRWRSGSSTCHHPSKHLFCVWQTGGPLSRMWLALSGGGSYRMTCNLCRQDGTMKCEMLLWEAGWPKPWLEWLWMIQCVEIDASTGINSFGWMPVHLPWELPLRLTVSLWKLLVGFGLKMMQDTKTWLNLTSL